MNIEKEYDLIVVGGGPGGYVAAIKAAQKGLKTACVEMNKLGGVCLNVGCIPTKTLLRSAKVFEYILNSQKYGIEITDKSAIKVDWKSMLDRKNKVVSTLVGGVAGLLKKNKVDHINGFGEFIDDNHLKVNNTIYKTKNFIIATGSKPAQLPIPGFDEGRQKGKIIDSTGILSIPSLPRTLAVIGGGVIGVEFAELMESLGVEVTIFQKGERLLEVLDKDVSKEITKHLKNKGVKILTNVNTKEYKNGKLYYEIDGNTENIEPDIILEAVGRSPLNTSIENTSVEINNKGFVVSDTKTQTKAKNIYAIGDINGKHMLAHVASYEGEIAVDNILGHEKHIDYGKIPNCIYTSLEIATIGKTEEELKNENYIDFKVSKFPMAANGKSLADGKSIGFIKIIADKEIGEILGVHIIGASATDLISEMSLALSSELTVEDIANAIHPHPTPAEAIMEAAHGIIDKPIHI